MAEEIALSYGDLVAEVLCDGEPLFAKSHTGRFPKAGEIESLLAPHIRT